MNIPRCEYPRPQMVRENWINLNGEWEFEIDFGKSGKARGLLGKQKLDNEILVPFCPESALSGVNYKDFMNAVWYKKSFVLPDDWKSKKTLINFEAVDYYCEVYINGEKAGSHKGGYTPFSFDITKYLEDGENVILVYVEDDVRTQKQPSGKQSDKFESYNCMYTRVTGIWQTVWLESVPKSYIESYEVTPDAANSAVNLIVNFGGEIVPKNVQLSIKYKGKKVGAKSGVCNGNRLSLTAELEEVHLWEAGHGRLYDLEIESKSEKYTDFVCGYFGLRQVELMENGVYINGKPVFQRLVLDQGMYPDGIYTAQSDETLKNDIQISMDLGFNGARLHQKVFERRFLYHADKMGYMVWGEYGSWGIDHTKASALEIFIPEWLEAMKRDYNSPALIGWCPLNETWDMNGRQQDNEVIRGIYLTTKAADKTRPVIDTSGNYHVQTDIYDVHPYEQDVKTFKEFFEPMKNGGETFNTFTDRQSYNGEPFFVSEYGGIRWNPKDKNGWGYGDAPESVEEFVERYRGLTETLLSNPKIFALCYTQLYDVEQEVNGLYYYDRSLKFDENIMKKLKEVMETKAEFEK
ncbi:MAG: beta-galactosidase [Oscillospiraceae bacterium]